MDNATIIGLIAGVALLIFGMSDGGSLMVFVDLPSVYITIGGSAAAMMINFPMPQFINAFRSVRWAFFTRPLSIADVINTLVSFAEKARREGLLALEEEAQNSDDAFLQKGIQLVVDGTDPALVKDILEIELAFQEERHKTNKVFFESWGALAPAFGMIGTVIGLIQMLKNLSDVSKIGPSMAVALITTFYGAVAANFLFLPIAGKLSIRSREEILVRQIMIEGILSIQAGENPRIVEEKLKSFLPPKERDAIQRRRNASEEVGLGA
jgi:chemotaxis protein MotA